MTASSALPSLRAQSLKSANARRLVHLHSALLEAGFLTYVELARLRGWEWVFEDVDRIRTGVAPGSLGSAIGCFWAAWVLGLKDEGRGLRRLRHFVVDRLRKAGVEKSTIAVLLGDEIADRSISDAYGSRAETPLSELQRSLDQCLYIGHNAEAQKTNQAPCLLRAHRGTHRILSPMAELSVPTQRAMSESFGCGGSRLMD